MKQLHLRIKGSDGKLWDFSSVLHKSKREEELNLQINSFYKEYRQSKDTPLFPHYEVELFYLSPELQFARRQIDGEEKEISLHIHFSDIEIPFMCWTADVPTEEHAIETWEIWCLGSVWSLQQFLKGIVKYDFAHPMQEVNWDVERFVEKMKNEGITIASKSY